VFKIYWPELRGETATSQTSKTTLTTRGDTKVITGEYGVQIHAKIRWFVVIRTPKQEKFSYCL
jgi:hypothetical protein